MVPVRLPVPDALLEPVRALLGDGVPEAGAGEHVCEPVEDPLATVAGKGDGVGIESEAGRQGSAMPPVPFTMAPQHTTVPPADRAHV